MGLERTTANFLGDFFGGFTTKIKELNDYWGLYNPDAMIKRNRTPELPVVQRFVTEIYGVEGYQKLPDETKKLLEDPWVNKVDILLSAMTNGLPPLAHSLFEGDLTAQQKANLIKPIPERTGGFLKQRTAVIFKGFNSQVSQELLRIGIPEYRLYNKVNVPAYDNAFIRIGSEYFPPVLKELVNSKGYIGLSDSFKKKVIQKKKAQLTATVRNIIISQLPQLEMQRLVRLLSDTERRAIFAEIRKNPGGKEYVESLNDMNIYEHPKVIEKLFHYSKTLDAKWKSLVAANRDYLQPPSGDSLDQAIGKN